MNIITKQAAAANQSATAVLSDAVRHYNVAEENMKRLMGAAKAAEDLAAVSGNADDKVAADNAIKAADNAIKAFKAANRAKVSAEKAAERAKAAHAKAQHAQDKAAAASKVAATDKTKGKQKAAPLTERAIHEMVVAYVSGNTANIEAARKLDVMRKDNTAKLQACAAAIPSQDRLIQWSLEIIKAAFADDKARADGAHKCKDRIAALKRLGAAYIAANASMGGLVFTIKALDKQGNYAVKFEAAPVESEAEAADKAAKQAAKDWAQLVELAAVHGITEAQLLAIKVKNEAAAVAGKAEAKAAKAAKAAARKAAKIAA